MGWTRITTWEGWKGLWAPCMLMWAAAAVAAIHPLAGLAAVMFAGIKRFALTETIHDHLLPHDEIRAPIAEINRQKALQIWWWCATGQVREAVECPARLASWCRSWMYGADAACLGALAVFTWERCAYLDAPVWGAAIAACILVLGLRAAEMQAATALWLRTHHRLPLDAVAAPLWPRDHLGRHDLWHDS